MSSNPYDTELHHILQWLARRRQYHTRHKQIGRKRADIATIAYVTNLRNMEAHRIARLSADPSAGQRDHDIDRHT